MALTKAHNRMIEGFPGTSNLFGLKGIKSLIGDKNDAHYGWGGVIATDSGKWIMIYRKATMHATEDGAEVRVRTSNDKGGTWENDALLYTDASHDARPDHICKMANGRYGFFVNRQDEGSTHFSPLFFKTDDDGATWSNITVTTTSPYTFASVGGIVEFPASQGGHDTTGFISYGYLDASGKDAFTTTDNGDTWSIESEVGQASGAITTLSESVSIRVGTQDKWIIFARASDAGGWHDELSTFTTTNMLNWGAPIDSGLENKGTPPGVIYDADTNMVHYLATARRGRVLDGLHSHLLVASVDADALYDAGGDFGSLGISYEVVSAIPDWFTGYVHGFQDEGRWYASFTFSESGKGNNVSSSSIGLIGDFVSSGVDALQMSSLQIRRQNDVQQIEIIADDNLVTNYPLEINNNAETATKKYGAYGEIAVQGGSEYVVSYDGDYTFSVDGDLKWDSDNHLFGGLTAPIASTVSAIHLGVQGSTFPAIRTSSGATSSRKACVFHNLNGEVGSISTSGTATAFTTSSDPRLKSSFSDLSTSEIEGVITDIANCTGKFNFLTDPTKEVLGFDAHKILDIKGLGSEIGTEGNGSRDLALGEEDGLDEEGNPLIVTPAGVDQSKAVPYLILAVEMLINRVKELEV